MLHEVTAHEIMTTRGAIEKYPTQYFIMVITEVVDQCDNDLGYVIYTADKRKELHKISRNEYKGKRLAFLFGDKTEPFPQVGNVVYYDED
jgi:hypothetical protein